MVNTRKEAREHIGFRLRAEQAEWLAELAKGYNLYRSDVIRAALAFAKSQPVAFAKILREMEERL